jgi:MerR family transcriptional regulator, heat shock protein HspR
VPDPINPAQPVYGISVAAELSGLGVQTLRLYEDRGLIEPQRSAGGTRRYSNDDIERLSEISSLVGEGLNLAGIAKVLELQREVHRLNRALAVARNRARSNTGRA